MIRLTRLSGAPVYVNADLIRAIESTPDTLLHLEGGERIMVLEAPEEVIDRIVAFRRRIYTALPSLGPPVDEPDLPLGTRKSKLPGPNRAEG